MGQNIVCNGYAVAFYALKKEAGIPCVYLSSNDESHAWDAVKLGGKWYLVDCTWDDGSAGSGYNGHRYCFVTDEALRTDHAYECPYTCNAVVCNYYVQEHICDAWLLELCDQVQSRLQNGSYAFSIDLASRYSAENHIYDASSVVGVTADLICKEYISLYNDSFSWQNTPVPLKLSVNRKNRYLWAEVNFAGRTLTLPASLKQLDQDAFMCDSRILAVVIPE